MKNKIAKSVVMIVLAVFLLPLTAQSEFYQYQDENGTVNFTDDPAKIPKKFKKKKKIRDDDMNDPESKEMRVKINGNQVLVPVTLSFRGERGEGHLPPRYGRNYLYDQSGPCPTAQHQSE